MTTGILWAGLWVVVPVLIVTAIGYNALIAYLHRRGLEGYAAVEVIGGTLFTLAGAAFIIGPLPALAVLVCFAASGLPMFAGSVWRFLGRLSDFKLTLSQLGKHHDEAATPAQTRQRDA